MNKILQPGKHRIFGSLCDCVFLTVPLLQASKFPLVHTPHLLIKLTQNPIGKRASETVFRGQSPVIQNKLSKRPRMNLRKNNTGNGLEEIKGIKKSQVFMPMGFPSDSAGKESTCQCRKYRRCRFDPWVRKIPGGGKWQSTPVFLPEKSHGQRSLVGYCPKGQKESDPTEQLSTAPLKTLSFQHVAN